MVRVGDWELRLVHSDTKQPFPEVRQQSGARTTYAVAAPGQAFEVQVTQHPNPSAKSQKAHSMHKVGIELGRSCLVSAAAVPSLQRLCIYRRCLVHAMVVCTPVTAAAPQSATLCAACQLAGIQATLEVDGQDVGFTKILKAIGTTATFRGFPKAGGAADMVC